MEPVIIVTILVLFQYTAFGIMAASARNKAGLKAPTMTGDEMFERANRVHQNTMEQLVMFLPVLWLFAYTINPATAAGLAVVYLIGRFIYRSAYLKDPGKRSVGFILTFMPTAIMAVWLFVDSAMGLL